MSARIDATTKVRAITIFARRLSAAFAAPEGRNYSECIAYAGHHTPFTSYRKSIQNIAAAVAAGQSFSMALSQHPEHFDPHFVAMVRLGEQGGNVDEVLEDFATQQEGKVPTQPAG